MRNVLVFAIIPIALCIVEYYITKKYGKIGLILPIITSLLMLLFGYILLIIGVILFTVYFTVRSLEKKNQQRLSEIDKMNIQDLE